MVILTCDGDNLAPECDTLAEKLKDGKRKVTHHVLEGMLHGFDKRCKEGTEDARQRDVAYALVAGAIREAFASS